MTFTKMASGYVDCRISNSDMFASKNLSGCSSTGSGASSGIVFV